jgi:hypothetical protein
MVVLLAGTTNSAWIVIVAVSRTPSTLRGVPTSISDIS